MKQLIVWIVIACLLLSGCGAPQKTQAVESQSGITFTDDLGRTVAVDRPQRVAALLGSYGQAWCLAGGTLCAAADDVWEEYDLGLPADAVNLGNTKSLSLERLLTAQPDFVIASTKTNQHLQWQPTLEAAGIPVAYFDVANFDDYLRVLKIFTDITGNSQLYEENGILVQQQIEAVIEKSKQCQTNPSVLVLRVSASSIRARGSEGNILGQILADLGCVNIADVDDSLLENLSIEHILQADPDYVFIAQYGDNVQGIQEHMQQFQADNPAWSQLTAVKTGKVYAMEKALYSLKPNHRWGEAYQRIEEILYNEA